MGAGYRGREEGGGVGRVWRQGARDLRRVANDPLQLRRSAVLRGHSLEPSRRNAVARRIRSRPVLEEFLGGTGGGVERGAAGVEERGEGAG